METLNPNLKSQNIYHIGGIPVDFPYKPYGSQLGFMSKVISTLDKGKRQGHCNALLESPTGTGKSLSLLCSALAWQQSYKAKTVYSNGLAHSTASSGGNEVSCSVDPMLHGGGFVVEPEPSSNLASGNVEATPSVKNGRNQKKKVVPTIYYASRTHSQISQVIREYRKTSYRVPMAVLASRKHYCTNDFVCGSTTLDEDCKNLLKNRDRGDVGCPEFRNANKVKGHPSLQKGGCHEAHDIEDLVKIGKSVKGCSYYAARSLGEEAQLVFCPYSYIINPTIRRAMEVDLKEAIVILDEAHNIEDMARDAASVDIEEEMLQTLQDELMHLCLADQMTYQPLCDMIQGITSWMQHRKDGLERHEFQHYSSCWTGDKAVKELSEAGITLQLYPILQECAAKAIKAVTDAASVSDAEPVVAHLSGLALLALEGLFCSLSYFFSENGIHAIDYQLVLQRFVKKDSGARRQTQTASQWTHTFSMWCLNPAVAFKEITDLSMSVILTSGTLSPMNSFTSELGAQFDTCMEAPHVIDVDLQLFAAVIPTGPGNYPLNASFKTADAFEFQDALGVSIEEICKIVPAGALVFFPSYKLMEKLCNRWSETGQWSRLNAQKSLFVEPRGNQDEFETALKGYYSSIRKRPTASRSKRGRKRGLNSHLNVMEMMSENSGKGGAAFLAVCRGKVSEGIDFSDDNARVVIIVGIPFSNIRDIQVAHKKKYNDTYKSSKQLLSGSEWYCQQAFRAMNQAAGRCIRHRFDYGGIIFLDERFKEERNITYVSKWIRKSIKQYDSFEISMEGLRSFFQNIKVEVNQEKMPVPENVDVIDIEEDMPFTEPSILSKRTLKKKNQNLNKPDRRAERTLSNNIASTGKTNRFLKLVKSERTDDLVLHKVNTQVHFGPLEPTQIEDASVGKMESNKISRYFVKSEKNDDRYISPANTEGYVGAMAHKDVSRFSPPQESRSETSSITSSSESQGEVLVKEIPGIDGSNLKDNSSVFKEGYLKSTANQTSNDLSDRLSCSQLANRDLCEGICDLAVTPEKNVETNIYHIKPEVEITPNLSVNSRAQKKRRPMFSNSYPQMDQSGNCPDTESLSDVVHARRMTLMNRRIHLCCIICKNSLGLPENKFLIMCSYSSSPKHYLASFCKVHRLIEKLCQLRSLTYHLLIGDFMLSQKVKVMQIMVYGLKKMVVCSRLFCPLCATPDTLLGLQIMATDASNVHLLNKILFYSQSVEEKIVHATDDQLRLPKKDLFSTTEN